MPSEAQFKLFVALTNPTSYIYRDNPNDNLANDRNELVIAYQKKYQIFSLAQLTKKQVGHLIDKMKELE